MLTVSLFAVRGHGWWAPVLVAIFGFVVGLAAYRWKRYARFAELLVMSGALSIVAWEVGRNWPSHWLAASSHALWCATPLMLALRARAAPIGFAVGVLAAIATTHTCEPFASTLVLGFVVGRGLCGDSDDLRTAVSMVGAGALAMLVANALVFDVTTIVGAHHRVESVFFRAHIDGPETYVPRLLLELGVLVAALAVARHRVWGILLVLALVPTLSWWCGLDYFLPSTESGCTIFVHPFDPHVRGNLKLELGLLVVLPWLLPLLRALRGTRS